MRRWLCLMGLILLIEIYNRCRSCILMQHLYIDIHTAYELMHAYIIHIMVEFTTRVYVRFGANLVCAHHIFRCHQNK
jgi:hypothetical protein